MKTKFRLDEKYSFDLLQKYYESKGFKVSYEKGDDPPDAIFFLNSKKWEIEHTTLHLYYEINGKTFSEKNFESKIYELEKWIKKQNFRYGNNGWNLNITSPLSKKQSQQIKKAIFCFFNYLDKEAFYSIPNEVCDLVKTNYNTGEMHIFSILPSLMKIPNTNITSANIQSVLDYALKRIFDNKKKFISSNDHIGVNKSLLIQNKYYFLSPSNFKNALSKYSKNIKSLDNIILINNLNVKIFNIVKT